MNRTFPRLNPVLGNIAKGIVFVAVTSYIYGCSSNRSESGIADAVASGTTKISQAESTWYVSGQAALAKRKRQRVIEGPAKNVILFIADGHGITSNTALRILDGQRAGGSGEEHVLSFETFPHLALAKTYNTDAQVPDSAGTATAMLTGVKTRAGVLSVNESVTRGDCVDAQDNHLTTAFELAEDAGLATGVVTTARLTHATPAAAYAHSAERNYEDDSRLSAAQKEAGCEDIAAQFAGLDYQLDVAMGGGRRHFLPREITDSEGLPGKRGDKRNLIEEWQTQYPSGQYIENQSEFDALQQTLPVLGLFNSSHMHYEVDRASDIGGEPSLADMTAKAITLLSQNKKGFFLLVESGRVDHGHHAGNAYRALEDGRAYAKAVAKAVSMVNNNETLIIATADHSHTLTMAGYAGRGNPILGLSKTIDKEGDSRAILANDGLPYTTLGYANGPGAQIKRISSEDHEHVTGKDYIQPALVPLDSETHGGEDVAIYAQGPGAWLFDGTVEQHYIFHVIDSVLDW